ncbi:hypothetical protein Naga_100772g5 [Nannochloropsis gaditana]|uniref:Uncharacterized protein n=1 Tax=Nannochloropsis gaditana TaxID=72520 RepID=W7TRE8_9STRA|nr:hypothetical protein Naga_100772g5 [Nannochloropsis gaditana]
MDDCCHGGSGFTFNHHQSCAPQSRQRHASTSVAKLPPHRLRRPSSSPPSSSSPSPSPSAPPSTLPKSFLRRATSQPPPPSRLLPPAALIPPQTPPLNPLSRHSSPLPPSFLPSLSPARPPSHPPFSRRSHSLEAEVGLSDGVDLCGDAHDPPLSHPTLPPSLSSSASTASSSSFSAALFSSSSSASSAASSSSSSSSSWSSPARRLAKTGGREGGGERGREGGMEGGPKTMATGSPLSLHVLLEWGGEGRPLVSEEAEKRGGSMSYGMTLLVSPPRKGRTPSLLGPEAYGSSEEMVHGTAEGGAAETGTAGGVEEREEGRK